MAIWQYTIYLIPKTALAADGTLPGITVSEMEFDLPPLKFDLSAQELERAAGQILPAAKSWHANLRAFGNEEEHDINIWCEKNAVESVQIRIDLRQSLQAYVHKVVRFASELQCCFFDTRTLELVAANEEALIKSIAKSTSAKFVRDPRGFLESLSRNEDKGAP